MDVNEYSHHKYILFFFGCERARPATSPIDHMANAHLSLPLLFALVFCFCPYLFTWIISLFVVIPPFALPFSKFHVKMRAVLMHRRVAQIDEFKSGMESSRSDVVTVTPLQDFFPLKFSRVNYFYFKMALRSFRRSHESFVPYLRFY